MTKFDYWQRWGIDLDDTSFANAWAALGVAWPYLRNTRNFTTALEQALEVHTSPGPRLSWSFPVEPRGATDPRLAPAEEWAEAWPAFARDRDLRLAITDVPAGEPVLPWLRLLHETDPVVQSVSFRLPPAVRGPVDISWPLRLGYMPGNGGEAVIDAAQQLWPVNSLTRKIALGRDEGNCDVLVYCGEPRKLLRELLALIASIKTHCLLLAYPGSEDYGAERSRLEAARNELHASGHILLGSPMTTNDLAAGLNQFVAEISHSTPFDVAVARSLGHRRFSTAPARQDLFAGYTEWLAGFQLSDLAGRLSQRAQAMPAGAEIDLSELGARDEWLARGVGTTIPDFSMHTDRPLRRLPPIVFRRGATAARPGPSPPPPPSAAPTPAAPKRGGRGGGGGAAAGSESTVRRMSARTLALDPAAIPFNREVEGGTTLARVSEAIDSAEVTPEEARQRVARFLQQRSFVRRGREFQDAGNGFIAGVPTLVRVRIGPPESAWDSLPTEFPVDALPQQLEQWTLTVWMTEPEHLREPLSAKLRLPRDGASTEAEFTFKPLGTSTSFEGRITVMHRGRVLQTAILRASVQRDSDMPVAGVAPALEAFIPVRQSLGELKHRRKFDLAFVLNNTSAGRPLAVGLADNHAWLSDLSQSKAIASDISARLAPVAKSAADYAGGVTTDKGRALLVQLAQLGSLLYEFLVNQQINASGNRPDLAKAEYLQVISTKLDAVIPFEFIFDFAAPEDGALLCPKWRKGIENGECAASCDKTSGKHVCPMGFWGLQKVIERHALSPELAATGRESFLQSESSKERPALMLGGVSVFGASDRVKAPARKALARTLRKIAGKVPEEAANWDEWVACVKKAHPRLLIALAHTDGKGLTASLELGGKALKSVLLRETHIRSVEQDPPPLVALLGCDVVGTADEYGNHAAMFRSRGAAVVIATIATVLGEHAAKVGESLVAGLLSDSTTKPQRVGEALRAIKRKALLDGEFMPLCLIAYGDADWQIKH